MRINRQGRESTGFLEVRNEPETRTLSVRLSDTLVPVCVVVLERMKRVFDLEVDPAAVNAVLGPLAKNRPGLRVPGSFDGFEMAVRAILGQQISVIGARTLAGRIVTRFGTPISVPVPALGYLFPKASRMARATVDEVASLGIVGQRAETILALAKAISSGELHLEPGNRVEGTLRLLRKIPGIGEWTAQYIAMRGALVARRFSAHRSRHREGVGRKKSEASFGNNRKMASVEGLRGAPFMGRSGEKS